MKIAIKNTHDAYFEWDGETSSNEMTPMEIVVAVFPDETRELSDVQALQVLAETSVGRIGYFSDDATIAEGKPANIVPEMPK